MELGEQGAGFVGSYKHKRKISVESAIESKVVFLYTLPN